MNDPRSLLVRLDAIGASLDRSGQGLALLGLGSVGVERARLDEFSDLDFFAIVEPGSKQRYLSDLGWLSDAAPIAYAFRNTKDGFKVLYEDGIFCEMAVFEPDELSNIPFSEGRIVWKRPHVDDAIRMPAGGPRAAPEHGLEWLLGEALTNLYVGLSRFRRGERLAAARLIQQFAVDRVVDLAPRVEVAQPSALDVFAPDRRVEQRLPELGRQLPNMVPGYARSVEAAQAILQWLELHFQPNPAMVAAVRALCAGADQKRGAAGE